VLIVSPYGAVQYFVGDFDATTCQFHPRKSGRLDDGSSFYAPNTMEISDGRRLTWGWLNGFPSGHGWNGSLSLPRQLGLSAEGDLLQSPAPQLAKLRGQEVKQNDVRLQNNEQTFPLPKTNTLEILMTVEMQTAKSFHLKIGDGSFQPVSLNFDGSTLQVLDSKASLKLKGNEKLKLDIFLDRSVLEVFANDRVCFTKVFAPPGADLNLMVGTIGGAAEIKQWQAWPMKSIWEK
jgi:beta-fructofuranosidase